MGRKLITPDAECVSGRHTGRSGGLHDRCDPSSGTAGTFTYTIKAACRNMTMDLPLISTPSSENSSAGLPTIKKTLSDDKRSSPSTVLSSRKWNYYRQKLGQTNSKHMTRFGSSSIGKQARWTNRRSSGCQSFEINDTTPLPVQWTDLN